MPNGHNENAGSEQELITDPMKLSSVRDLVSAEIDVQIATAKAYPRSIGGFQANLQKLATTSTEVAELCEYAVPRDGKQITGPSARFAELVAFTFGNLRVAGRIVSIDEKFVTAQGVAHDLESNSAKQVEVKRRITNKKGSRYSEDMIQTTSQAAIAIAARNAILACIPQALWAEAFEASQKTAEGSKDDLPVRRQKLIEAWGVMGVAPQRILQRAGVESLEEVTMAKLKFLRSLYVAVKDGDMTLDELFPSSNAAPKPSSLDEMAAAPVPGKSPESGAISPANGAKSPAESGTSGPQTDLSTAPEVQWPDSGQSAGQTGTHESTQLESTAEDNGGQNERRADAIEQPASEAERTVIIADYRKQISRAITADRLRKIEAAIIGDQRLADADSVDLHDDVEARLQAVNKK